MWKRQAMISVNPPDPINSPGYRQRRRLVREALQLGESQVITFGDTQEPSLDLGWGLELREQCSHCERIP
jgi:hypothetical protein